MLDIKCIAANDLDHATPKETAEYWIEKCRQQLARSGGDDD